METLDTYPPLAKVQELGICNDFESMSRDECSVTESEDEDDEDFEMVHTSAPGSGSEDDYFDQVVSCMEDVMMECGFEDKICSFCRQHCDIFSDSEENKLEYMAVYKEYVSIVETTLEAMVEQRIEDFSMAAFLRVLARCPAKCLHGDLFDTLMTVTDFDTFKAHMLSFKTEAHLADLVPTVSGVQLHADEQEAGDARPDLDSGSLHVCVMADARG